MVPIYPCTESIKLVNSHHVESTCLKLPACIAQTPFCLYLVLFPLENSVVQVGRILFRHWHTVCALPVLFPALKKHAKVGNHRLSLIFTLPLKERSITVLCLLSRIYFSRNQTISNGKTAREAELQNERIFYHPLIAVIYAEQ